MTEGKGPRELHLRIPALVRVEGEAALELRLEQGEITRLQLNIYEPPRYFEKLLEGRDYHEVPDIVARICGICPVAYQMSAVHAIEQVFGIDPGPWVREMRRLFYCGEWIESHALHIHLLAAPDFLGFDSVVAMAQRYPDEVRRGLRLQALGNDLIALLGARSVHPVGARVGGFHQAPAPAAAAALAERVRLAIGEAHDLLRWTATLCRDPASPERCLSSTGAAQTFTYMALRHADEYPMNEGRIQVSDGTSFEAAEFAAQVTEFQVPHSTALHAHYRDAPYLVGPLARLNLNYDRLPPAVQQALAATGIAWPSTNMFHSIVARAVEILYALYEAAATLERYTPQRPAQPPGAARAGVGVACTEAPRGLLWHRYELDAQGQVRQARIVPPTSQNQARIEAELRAMIHDRGAALDDAALRRRCEQVIRNYDPCISCATHFLRLQVERA